MFLLNCLYININSNIYIAIYLNITVYSNFIHLNITFYITITNYQIYTNITIYITIFINLKFALTYTLRLNLD